MEEPNSRTPVPSQHPSVQLLENSSLDLTPERKKTSKRFQRSQRGPQSSDHSKQLSGSKQHNITPSGTAQLSQPHLNSTAHLYSKIHTLKQQQKHSRHPTPTQSEENSPKGSPSLNSGSDLQHFVHNRPLKEVNVPSDAVRYSDLRSVDVSEESFTKMTVRPRKNRHTAAKTKPSQISRDEPDIMEIFTPEMEYEEAEWTMGKYTTNLEPVHVRSDAPFTLYKHMHKCS